MATQSILGARKIVSFVATRNPALAKAFYGHTLGLRFIHEDQFAIVFDAHGTTLRVTIVNDISIAPYTVLGWEVSDVAATARELQKAGVTLLRFQGMDQNELGIWASPSGAKVGWFKDPDGNTLSVTEL